VKLCGGTDRFFRLSERLTDYNFKMLVKMHDLARRDAMSATAATPGGGEKKRPNLIHPRNVVYVSRIKSAFPLRRRCDSPITDPDRS